MISNRTPELLQRREAITMRSCGYGSLHAGANMESAVRPNPQRHAALAARRDLRMVSKE